MEKLQDELQKALRMKDDAVNVEQTLRAKVEQVKFLSLYRMVN